MTTTATAGWLPAAALALTVSACAPTKVRPVSSDDGGEALPQPDREIAREVADGFAVVLGNQLGKLFVRYGWISEHEAR